MASDYVSDLMDVMHGDKVELFNEFDRAFEEHLELLDIDVTRSIEDNLQYKSKTEDGELTKWVYVNLWHGGDNIVSKLIMAQQKSIYSHSSISLDKYGRPFYEMQLKDGFRTASYFDNEYLSFGKASGRVIEFYGLHVTESKYKDFIRTLKRYEKNSDKIEYSLKKLLAIALNIQRKTNVNYKQEASKENEFICSGFVLSVLMQNDPTILKYVKQHNKHWDLYSPVELLNLPGLVPLHVMDTTKPSDDVVRQVSEFEKENNIELN